MERPGSRASPIRFLERFRVFLPARVAVRLGVLLAALAAVLAAVLLAVPSGAKGAAAPARPVAHSLGTSRWWRLACDGPGARGQKGAPPPPCVLTVQLRGPIDRSRLRLLQHAVARREPARRALGRDIAIRVDVDSQGGEVFAATEIGRLLRRDGASLTVGRDASCVSACVLVLMGAPSRSVAAGARVGIHRPSLGASRGGARELDDALAGPIALYAEEMTGSRRIVDAMWSVPPRRVRYLTPAELSGYGIPVSQAR